MSSDRQSRYLTAMLSALIASVLLYLAVPRVIAEFIAWPGDAVLSRLQEKEEVSKVDLKLMAESLKAALKWQYSSRRQSNVGIAEVLLAEKIDATSENGPQLLEMAINLTRASLKNAPARPYTWAWLTYSVKRNNGVGRELAPTLNMSLKTGFQERHLMLTRLKLAFEIWPYLSDAMKSRVSEQVRFAWKLPWSGTRTEFIDIISSTHAQEIVREAFSKLPKELLKLEKRLHRVSGIK